MGGGGGLGIIEDERDGDVFTAVKSFNIKTDYINQLLLRFISVDEPCKSTAHIFHWPFLLCLQLIHHHLWERFKTSFGTWVDTSSTHIDCSPSMAAGKSRTSCSFFWPLYYSLGQFCI